MIVQVACMPASQLWLGTCWAIWQPFNWVGVLHMSRTPPKRWLEQKPKRKLKPAVHCILQQSKTKTTATVEIKVRSTDALGFAFSSCILNHLLSDTSDTSDKTTQVERTLSGGALHKNYNHFVQKHYLNATSNEDLIVTGQLLGL